MVATTEAKHHTTACTEHNHGDAIIHLITPSTKIMANNSSNRQFLMDQWWSGVRLWYNEQDFLSAMEVWDHAIESVEDVEWDDDNEEEMLPAKDQAPLTGNASLATPLLLFLAGCYLDAGNTQKARKLCRRCLTTEQFRQALCVGSTTFAAPESNKTTSTQYDFAHCALSEYAATYQEDDTITDPCQLAHQIATWAIQEFQQTSSSLPQNNQVTPYLWRDPRQRPGYLYPSISSQPVYPREEHPDWCRTLEHHYPTIRQEYQHLMRNSPQQTPQHWPRVGAGDHRDGAGQHDGAVVNGGGDWREWILFGSGASDAAGSRAPRTCQLLQQLAPQAVDLAHQGAGEIILSVLAPHTHIAPHCASTNLRLTAHLGLQVPTSTKNSNKNDDNKDNNNNNDDDCCYIQVAGQKLNWQEGKMIVFDDSYEHEVHNHTDEIRAVLLMRFWHPNLTKHDRSRALQHVLNAKETDRLRRCNPPLPPILKYGSSTSATTSNGIGILRHPQGMNQQLCPTCGRSGFETIRLVRPEDHGFVCICGREAPLLV